MNQDAYNPILIDTQKMNQSLAFYLDERIIQKVKKKNRGFEFSFEEWH